MEKGKVLETNETLKMKSESYRYGFEDGLNSNLPNSKLYNLREYCKGYAIGSIQKDHFRGMLISEVKEQLCLA